MKKNEFQKLIRDNIGHFLPEKIRESCEIKCVEINKTNDSLCHGIAFHRTDSIAEPILYIDEAYEDYIDGKVSIKTVIEDMAEAIAGSWDRKMPFEEMSFEYKDIKDKLCFQLVDTYANETRLSTLFHNKLSNGLAMVYYVIFSEDEDYRAPITKEMATSMGYDLERLNSDAIANMQKLYPAVLTDGMSEFGDEMPLNFLEIPYIQLAPGPYMLTTKNLIFGASAILYPGIQERLGNMFGTNYLVIPSSNMELMILPSVSKENIFLCKQLLLEGNKTLVSDTEFLSNRLFMYDRKTNSLKEV